MRQACFTPCLASTIEAARVTEAEAAYYADHYARRHATCLPADDWRRRLWRMGVERARRSVLTAFGAIRATICEMERAQTEEWYQRCCQ